MERYGSNGKDMRGINHEDTFLGRVKLLVVMLKAFIGDYPLQGIRLEAIARNADAINKVCEDWSQYTNKIKSNSGLKRGLESDHIFHQRVNLLAIMAKSFVEGNPMGCHREKAIRANIGYIIETIQFNPQEEFADLFRAA